MTESTTSPRPRGRPPGVQSGSPIKTSPRPQSNSSLSHEVRIRRQASPVPSAVVAQYACDVCAFTTNRVNVLICHRKTHTNESPSKSSPAQKRSASPVKKTTVSKRKKTLKNASVNKDEENGAIEEVEEKEDLFDQVKRSLEGKEAVTPKGRRKSVKSPKSTPKVAKNQSPAKRSPSEKSTPSAKTKAQLCPKKKWLTQAQKEVNPEVKIKLMADWDEDEHEESTPVQVPAATTKTEECDSTESQVIKQTDSDSENELPSSSGLLHQRSDDEDEEPEEPEVHCSPQEEKTDELISSEQNTDEPVNSEKKTDELLSNQEQTDKPISSSSEEKSVNNGDHALVNIGAEIDKLNAEIDQIKPLGAVNTEEIERTTTNGVDVDSHSSETDDKLKQQVASLLSETVVPVLPDTFKTTLAFSSQTVEEAEAVPEPLEDVVVASSEAEMEAVQSGVLMQVEDTGETYMVMWEPGSNIDDLLACDNEGGGQTLHMVQPAANELENLFQMAVSSNAGNVQPTEQSNQT